VEIAAILALLGPGGEKLLFVALEDHTVYEVAGALVIDGCPRAELGDGEEAGSGEELLAVVAAARARDEGGDREPREAVAGEEAFACEVAAAVEVRESDAVGLGDEEVQLRLGLAPEPLGLILIPLATGSVADDLVLRHPLG